MTNELGKEKSPYLLQHKNNPVHWKAWGTSAFEMAREKDRLIFLSIGYATCHWCHVMEKDSFENESIATLLNANFICVKVDREERPDVDAVYMQATVSMNGHGGWPMSLFLTPDGKVVWSGTFLQRDRFAALSQEIHRVWNSPTRERMLSETEELNTWFINQQKISTTNQIRKQDLMDRYRDQMLSRFDSHFGGFGRAPKFPQVPQLNLIQFIADTTKNADLFRALDETLYGMARGGIQDHIDGGFHRYSTDSEWKLPHFEKMLYDNALLAPLYARRARSHPEFKYIAERTLDYIYNRLKSSDGGFFCGEDADSDHTEGRFYVFTETELQKFLTEEEFQKIKTRYQILPEGNFHIDQRASELEKAAGYKELHAANVLYLPQQEKLVPDQEISRILQKLSVAKTNWNRPLLDDKCLASWNGMMLQSLVENYILLERPQEKSAAKSCVQFIKNKFLKSEKFLRRYRDGESAIEGMLEDYVFVISGLLSYYQIDSNPEILQLCETLQQKQNELFWDTANNGFFNQAKTETLLPFRHKEFYDHATQNCNGMSAMNLNILHRWTGNLDYKLKRDKLIETGISFAQQAPTGCPTLILASALSDPRSETVEIFHPDQTEANKILCKLLRSNEKHFLSGRWINSDDKKIQYCQENACVLSSEIS